MTVRVVLADANILYSRTMRDYFLYAAGEGVIEIHWSQPILDEMSRNLREKLGLTSAATARLEMLMNDYLDDALVVLAHDDLAILDGVEMDDGDRHVVAAAVTAGADVLLTENIRHFPRTWMSEHGIELMPAGDLLALLAKEFPSQMRAVHEKAVRFSPRSEPEILATLERITGPAVVDAIRALAVL